MRKIRSSLPTFGCPICSQGLIRFVAIDRAGATYQCDECGAVMSEQEEAEKSRRETPATQPPS